VEVLVPLKDASDRRVAYAKIDPESEWIRRYPWYRLTADGDAVTFSDRDGRPTTMARVILGIEEQEGVAVRYRNGDRLDNRRENLRAERVPTPDAPPAEGAKRSRYRWVLWDAEHEAWVAYGERGGRHVHLGRFDDELAAARAAREWALEHQTIHFEDDHHGGGYGRSLRAPTALSEANRRRSPIGGKE
jgi:hypothetical protein